MRDSFGREIAYLRLSLTERCNLACIYCRGAAGPQDDAASWSEAPSPGAAGAPGAAPQSPGEAPPPGGGTGPGDMVPPPGVRELGLNEIRRIIPCLISLGIRKVRLTGGEPLLREDLEDIAAYLGSRREIQDLALTTNGQGLAPRARALKRAGLGRVNISLDSLDPRRYRDMTGGGDLGKTLEGIGAALSWGLGPVKLNCVLIRGRNDDEAGAFIALAREQPLHVRFIELMPFGANPAARLRVLSPELLAAHGELYPLAPEGPGGPGGEAAALYTGRGFRGTVGFISPLSRPFCHNCGRIRITADGKLKTCLGHDGELDLRSLLEGPDRALRSAVEGEIVKKPRGHRFDQGFVPGRTMDRIGG
jgi:cyclic pyranopterin phosphate synthase